MKCLVVLSLVALASAGPLDWQNIWPQQQLGGQWGPVHQQYYGNPLLQQHLWGPKTHEKVLEEHPVGQIAGHHVAEQIVAQDQQAALHSALGHQLPIQHPYGSIYHKQFPYGYLNTIKGYQAYPLFQQHPWGTLGTHEKVIEEHPVGQIGTHQVAEQIVAQDQQAALHSTLGHEYGIEHPYGKGFYGYAFHKQFPYGYLDMMKGHMGGYPYYPSNIWSQQGQGIIGGHSYPWAWHHSIY